MSAHICIVLTSVDDIEAARAMARGLVEGGLAACVQISAAGESWYRWRDAIRHETEFFLVVKTSAGLRKAAVAWLHERHPYELPEIIWFSADASPDYAAWLHDQLGEV